MTSPMDSISDLILLKKGFSKEIYAQFSMFVIPIDIFASCLGGYFAKKKIELKLFIAGNIFRCINNA